MRKAVLMMAVLAVVSDGAMAAWVYIGGHETKDAYADPTTIRKAGYRVKIWTLLDSRTPQNPTGARYMSAKAQKEFACNEQLGRFHYYSWHSGNMGNGEVTFSRTIPMGITRWLRLRGAFFLGDLEIELGKLVPA